MRFSCTYVASTEPHTIFFLELNSYFYIYKMQIEKNKLIFFKYENKRLIIK